MFPTAARLAVDWRVTERLDLELDEIAVRVEVPTARLIVMPGTADRAKRCSRSRGDDPAGRGRDWMPAPEYGRQAVQKRGIFLSRWMSVSPAPVRL